MSAENFNTMQRKVLPPLEFQDSPRTTLLRSSCVQNYAQRLAQNVISKAIATYQQQNFNTIVQKEKKEHLKQKIEPIKLKNKKKMLDVDKDFQLYSCNIYGSDSFLNHTKNSKTSADTDIENIYDEPNTDYDFYDVIYKGKNSEVLCTKRIIRSYDKNRRFYTNSSDIYYKYKCERSEKDRNKDSRYSDNETYNIIANDNANNHINNINYSLNNSFQRKFDSFLKRKFLINNVSGNTTSLTTTASSILYSPHHCNHKNTTGSNLSSSNCPNSRNSLNSRLSSSHNSLTVQSTNKADDSIFITQAMSHDPLLSHHSEIPDFYNVLYNVPHDSDIYTLPVDDIQPKNRKLTNLKPKTSFSLSDNNLLHDSRGGRISKQRQRSKIRSKKRRRCDSGCQSGQAGYKGASSETQVRMSTSKPKSKRFSVPENSTQNGNFMQLSLDETKKYYNDLYSTSSDSSPITTAKNSLLSSRNTGDPNVSFVEVKPRSSLTGSQIKTQKSVNLKKNKTRDVAISVQLTKSQDSLKSDTNNNKFSSTTNKKSKFSISMNLKQKFCSIFRFRKSLQNARHLAVVTNKDQNNKQSEETGDSEYGVTSDNNSEKKINLSTRALPPLPGKELTPPESKETMKREDMPMDFSANIEKVKEYGWYWGPISSEGAEKILSNEADGSFIVRDSSDDHYIFSLTFKLNGCVRHVRIEQDQGTFSFGSCAKFKSRTIMEFIENAVEHSRSGRYLFFLHRRPEHGPMRVQLTNPVSRFKHIQSLQHMCRFVILKAVVRKDLIDTLPLPRRLIDYLKNKNVLSEQVESDSDKSQVYGERSNSTSDENTITRM
jgi:suppressor of cytokine signaling 7